MPLAEPFKEIPKTAAEWNRWQRSLLVTPDAAQVTEATIADNSVTPVKLSEAYYTEAEVDAFLALYYSKLLLDAGQLDTRYYTETEIDTHFATGTYTGTLTGCTTTPTDTIRYDRSDNLITLYVPQINATSNATTMTITGGPAAIYPARAQRVPFIIQDNGVVQLGLLEVGIDGVLTFYSSVAAAVFTNTGNKGVELQTITYSIS